MQQLQQLQLSVWETEIVTNQLGFLVRVECPATAVRLEITPQLVLGRRDERLVLCQQHTYRDPRQIALVQLIHWYQAACRAEPLQALGQQEHWQSDGPPPPRRGGRPRTPGPSHPTEPPEG